MLKFKGWYLGFTGYEFKNTQTVPDHFDHVAHLLTVVPQNSHRIMYVPQFPVAAEGELYLHLFHRNGFQRSISWPLREIFPEFESMNGYGKNKPKIIIADTGYRPLREYVTNHSKFFGFVKYLRPKLPLRE